MSHNKEGQNLLSLHSSGSVCHIYTLGYSDSLTPHRWSRRNQVSNFENDMSRNPVKGANRQWWLDYFQSILLASQMQSRKVRCPEDLVTEQPPRVRLRAKRERWPNSEQELNWEKADDSWYRREGEEVCSTSLLILQGIKLDAKNTRCRRKLPWENASKKFHQTRKWINWVRNSAGQGNQVSMSSWQEDEHYQ